VGKTTLMVKYVENKFDEDYIQTLGEWWYTRIHTFQHSLTYSLTHLLTHSNCVYCMYYVQV
jgi:GTPase SAR1 family protein